MYHLPLSILIAVGLQFFCKAQIFAQSDHNSAPSKRQIENSEILQQLQHQLHQNGLEKIVTALSERAEMHSSFEGTLIECVKADAHTDEGRKIRRLAARLLGETHSFRAVPALVDNITMLWENVVASSEFVLGEIRLRHPCVRALVDIGAPAQPLIIQRIAESKQLDDFQCELAAYCLLKIQIGEQRPRDVEVSKVHRDAVLAAVDKVIESPGTDNKSLAKLRQFVAEVEPLLYDSPRSPRAVNLRPPANSEYFKRNPLPDPKDPPSKLNSQGEITK